MGVDGVGLGEEIVEGHAVDQGRAEAVSSDVVQGVGRVRVQLVAGTEVDVDRVTADHVLAGDLDLDLIAPFSSVMTAVPLKSKPS